MANRFTTFPESWWAYTPKPFKLLSDDLKALEAIVGGGSASAAGVTASSAREEVYPYLPKPYPATQVSASMTVWPETSAQWATSLVALGENSRLGFVAQVPSNATEPLKVAEGTSQGDSYNPSASRTDVPAGSEVVLSAGNTFLTAHFTTASQPVRIKQITGV